MKLENEPHQLTVEEFHAQVLEFRKLFGTKDFWQKPTEARQKACDALGLSYLFLQYSVDRTEVERCAHLLQSTLDEYTRREFMLIRVGKVNMN